MVKVKLTKDQLRVIVASMAKSAGTNLGDFIHDKKKSERYWHRTWNKAIELLRLALFVDDED